MRDDVSCVRKSHELSQKARMRHRASDHSGVSFRSPVAGKHLQRYLLILRGGFVCSVLFLQLRCLFCVEGVRDFGEPTEGFHGALLMLFVLFSLIAGHLNAQVLSRYFQVATHSSPQLWTLSI